MRIIADLRIHSKYSGATSSRMVLEELSYYDARLKGLDVLGTGDALHTNWMEEGVRTSSPAPHGFAHDYLEGAAT
jgi:DNA helicase-2/ATP-dependent DNA helicase PcrA